MTVSQAQALPSNARLQQLPEIFTRLGSPPITPDTLSSASALTTKRKFSESIDLEEGEARQRRLKRLAAFSPRLAAHESSRRPVSWHESVLGRLPHREEWKPPPLLGPSERGPRIDTRLPAIQPWQPGVGVPEELATFSSQYRDDPFRSIARAPIPSTYPPLRELQRAAPHGLLHRAESAPAPVYHVAQSPGTLNYRSILMEPWSPSSAINTSSYTYPPRSPRRDAGLRSVTEDVHRPPLPERPQMSWSQVDGVGPIPSDGRQRSFSFGRPERPRTAHTEGARRNTSPKSGGTVMYKARTSSISPRQEHQTKGLEPISKTDSRSFTLSAQTSPVSQYNWEVPDATESGNRRRRGNLPKESTAVLNTWFCQHITYPYPKEEEKHRLQAETNLSMSQVSACTVALLRT